MEEALKCNGLAAVTGELSELSFNSSRRLQLAVEQSAVTGFVIRRKSANLNTTACLTRWLIRALPSEKDGDMPGVGFPGWRIELQKVRNGKPGIWDVEWKNNQFKHKTPVVNSVPEELKKKVG
jgi:protein ImuA